MRFLTLLLAATALIAQQKENAALEGLDPVLLTQGREEPGKDSITARHGKFLYQFSSEATRDQFTKDPSRYEIQMEGACARMGPPVTGRADSYYVHDGKIYIFASDDCYKAFKANPKKFIDSEPPSPWNPSADARRQGRKLLQQALDAMGGSDKWDAIHSFTETRIGKMATDVSTTLVSGQGPDTFSRVTRAGRFEFGDVVTAAGASRFANGKAAQETSELVIKARREDIKSALLPLLLSRNAPGFDLYYSGRVGGVDRIETNDGGFRRALLLDVATHRIAGLTWHGRDKTGIGEFHAVFSDFRDAAGLLVPFDVKVEIDGEIVDFRTYKIQSYEWNPADIDARLTTSVHVPQPK